MTREQIREWTLREPFVPFVVVTRAGKRYRIPDYGYVLVRRSSLYIKTAGAPWEFDLPFTQVARCEPISRRGRATGRRTRRA